MFHPSFKTLVSAVILLSVTACNDDVDAVLEGDGDNNYQVINASEHYVEYHFALEKSDGDRPDVMSDKYLKVSLEATQASSINRDRKVLRKQHIGVAAPNTDLSDQTTRLTPRKGDKYLVVAWGTQGGLALDVLKSKTINNSSQIQFRWFTTDEDIQVTLDGQTMTNQVGKVSTHHHLENCENSLVVNATKVDLCNQVTANASYFVVLNKQGLVTSVKE